MQPQPATPVSDRPIVAWIGDDFTGAAAVLEVLSFSGISSVLFLDTPSQDQLDACGDLAAIGIATMARACPPDWMDRELPPLYSLLDATGAELVHYKICSTLDSAPHVGSIGKAIDLGLEHFGDALVPVVTAAPAMRRYQMFGNLFCGAPDGVFRLDRHPVMSRHPVTPMHEADVARHIAAQTQAPTDCLDLEQLVDTDRATDVLNSGSSPRICTFDMADAQHERAVGKLLWERRSASRFVVGSQGIEYALVAHLRASGLLPETPAVPALDPVALMPVVSGSVSPISARQIAWAKENGFEGIRLDVLSLCASAAEKEQEEQRVVALAMDSLARGLSPLVYSAEGPDDPHVKQIMELVATQGDAINAEIGRALGRILKVLIADSGLTRVTVSGGDTSGHVCQELGIFAVEAAAPTIPGASIFRAAKNTEMQGLEIALKGGQMGSQDYYGWVRAGGGAR